jgi:hypothetical protein
MAMGDNIEQRQAELEAQAIVDELMVSAGATIDSLKNPPRGGELRRECDWKGTFAEGEPWFLHARGNFSSSKPWEEAGVSRATWYRHRFTSSNVPTPDGADAKYSRYIKPSRQGREAEWRKVSTRTIQREAFLKKYGIGELNDLHLHEHYIEIGVLEKIAYWDREDQYEFVVRLVGMLEKAQQTSKFDASLFHLSPIRHACGFVDRAKLRKLAKELYRTMECELIDRELKWCELSRMKAAGVTALDKSAPGGD